MKVITSILAILLFVTVRGASADSGTACLKVLTEDFAPFNYIEQGKVTGFSVEIVKRLIETTGVCTERNKILLWPWKRAYQAALSEPNVLLFTTTRTAERDKLFKWVGPIYPRQQVLFKLAANKDINIATLDDARKYTVVATNNSANHDFLIAHGFEEGKNLISANHTESKIKMFLSGRADIAFFLPIEIAYQLKQRNSKQELEQLDIRQEKLEYYLAFSQKTPDDIVRRFQNALDAMKKDGVYKDILDEYLK